MDGNWIVPFRGRNYSGAYSQNFLWNDGPVYVMDNHRAALWCWLQKLDLKSKHSIIHIDRHTDTLQSRIDEWLKHLPSSWDLTIDEYLNHEYKWEMGSVPVIRWDNYLSIYFAQFGKNIDHCYFATHNDGDKPNYHCMRCDIWALPSNMDYWLDERNKPWIVNIDLDYFFWRDLEYADVMFSDAYLSSCFKAIADKVQANIVSVVTISLSPSDELTGGWNKAEVLARKVLAYFDIEFELPMDPTV